MLTLFNIIGLLFSMFLVGYLLTFLLFPRRDLNPIDRTERIALSLGTSVVLVTLAGLLLSANTQVASFWQLITGTKGLSQLNLVLILFLVIFLSVFLAKHRYKSHLTLPNLQSNLKEALNGKRILKVFKESKRSILLIVVIIVATLIKWYPLYYFNNLPEGEAAKAVFWGKLIIESHTIPDYSYATMFYGRPADYNTPGLHVFVASVGLLSGLSLIYIVGIITVVEAIAASLLIYAITYRITGNRIEAALSILFSSLALPLLRYTNLPGYHFQNLIGEVLILFVILLILHLLEGNGLVIPLLGLSAFSLLTTHQLSIYIFLFVSIGYALTIIAFRRRETVALLRKNFWILVPSFIVTTFCIVFSLVTIQSYILNAVIYEHVGTISETPLWVSHLPSLNDYLFTLGALYVFLSLIGILFCLKRLLKAGTGRFHCIFLLSWLLVVLILSQGPRLGLTVDPSRVMNYMAAPLSIYASIGISEITKMAFSLRMKLKDVRSIYVKFKLLKRGQKARKCVNTFILFLVISATFFSFSFVAFEDYTRASEIIYNAKYSARSGMLDSETYDVLKWLEKNTSTKDRILIDYWGAARLEWALASGRLISLRLGPIVGAYQYEYVNSPWLLGRKNLYENYLNFEKIFMMGNTEFAAYIMKKYNFNYVIATEATLASFSKTTYFSQKLKTKHYSIYKFNDLISPSVDESDRIILDPYTLANDLGDKNDFIAESEAVLDPPSRWKAIYLKGATAQTPTDSVVYLRFNLEPYVNDIWDKNADGVPDGNLTFLMRYYDNNAQIRIYGRSKNEWNYEVVPSAIIGNNTQEWKVKKLVLRSSSVWIDQGKLSMMLRVDMKKDTFIIDWIALGLEKSATYSY